MSASSTASSIIYGRAAVEGPGSRIRTPALSLRQPASAGRGPAAKPYGEGDRREQAGRRPPRRGLSGRPAGLSAAGSECVEVVDAALVEELNSPLLLPRSLSVGVTRGGRGGGVSVGISGLGRRSAATVAAPVPPGVAARMRPLSDL